MKLWGYITFEDDNLTVLQSKTDKVLRTLSGMGATVNEGDKRLNSKTGKWQVTLHVKKGTNT